MLYSIGYSRACRHRFSLSDPCDHWDGPGTWNSTMKPWNGEVSSCSGDGASKNRSFEAVEAHGRFIHRNVRSRKRKGKNYLVLRHFGLHWPNEYYFNQRACKPTGTSTGTSLAMSTGACQLTGTWLSKRLETTCKWDHWIFSCCAWRRSAYAI